MPPIAVILSSYHLPVILRTLTQLMSNLCNASWLQSLTSNDIRSCASQRSTMYKSKISATIQYNKWQTDGHWMQTQDCLLICNRPPADAHISMHVTTIFIFTKMVVTPFDEPQSWITTHFAALSFTEPELLLTEVLHCRTPLNAAVTLTLTDNHRIQTWHVSPQDVPVHQTSVVTDSESTTESADYSRVRPSPNPRIFCGCKWRFWVVCLRVNIYLSGDSVQATCVAASATQVAWTLSPDK